VVEQLLAEDEIMGAELEKLWERLGQEIRPLTAKDRGWPDELIAPSNPFYVKEGR